MSKRAGTLLGAAGAVLIVLVVILLWSLGAPPERETRRDRGARTRVRAASPARRHPPPPRSTAPARATGPVVLPPTSTAPAAAPDAATAGVAGAPTPTPAPVSAPGTHMAPAAIPAEITNETDPARKAQLMRMHELAVARSRASRLRRRARLLRNTLATAKEQGSWEVDKIQRAEKDLTQIGKAIKLAERNAKLAAERAGIKD